MLNSVKPASHIEIHKKYQKSAHKAAQEQEETSVSAELYRSFSKFKVQQIGGMPSYIEFHPTNHRRYLVTNSNSVQLFEDEYKQIAVNSDSDLTLGDEEAAGTQKSGTKVTTLAKCSTFSKFDMQPYSATFRPNDGLMMAVAGESGKLQLMRCELQLASGGKHAMRRVHAHSAPCHLVRFLHHESINQVFSASDDKSVKVFDILMEKQLRAFPRAHEDYVRAGCAFEDNGSLFATASYDHTVKVWDIRDAQSQKMSFDHGAPVEFVARHPTSPLLFTAGGSYFKVWDLLRPELGKPLRTVHSHQNTVTSLFINREATRVVTCGLDRQLKIHDVAKDYAVVHSMTFPDAILSAAVSGDERMIAVGLRTKLMKARRADAAAADAAAVKADRLNSANYRYLINTHLLEQINETRDQIYTAKKREANVETLRPLLAKFRYKEALDQALTEFGQDKPVIIMSLLEELKSRNELLNALDARNEVTLLPLLKFLVKHLRDPRFSGELLELADIVMQIYGQVLGMSSTVDAHFKALRAQIRREVKLQTELHALRGTIDSLMLASTVHRQRLQQSSINA